MVIAPCFSVKLTNLVYSTDANRDGIKLLTVSRRHTVFGVQKYLARCGDAIIARRSSVTQAISQFE